MKYCAKFFLISLLCMGLSGCLVTSVVSGVVGTVIDVVDTITPDIID